MADILIRGMEMPESCDKCSLFNECWCMALGVENWRKSYNKPPDGGRLPDCPIVPLPEGHGRLGDLDALEREISDAIYNYWNGGDNGFYLAEDALPEIRFAPTIVPAEGGGENG